MKKTLVTLLVFAALFAVLPLAAQQLNASPDELMFKLSLDGGKGNFTKAVNIFLLLTLLSLAPIAILMMTSFTRIVIVIGFLKTAMGVTQAPSARIVAALAMFLSIFIMQPVWTDIYKNALQPYSDGKINQEAAMKRAETPIKAFMLKQTRENTLLLFMDLANMSPVDSPDDLPLRIVIPAFMISELKTAFQMGFLVYLPFLVIDLVVSTVLMAMGMMMLPPSMISMPFKLLLFVLVDGWELVVRSLIASFG